VSFLLGQLSMKRGYCLSCYGPRAYIFSVPLRASTAWLTKVLRRKHLINAVPLRRSQFETLSRRVMQPVEVGWYDELQYFLEGFRIGREPNESVERMAAGGTSLEVRTPPTRRHRSRRRYAK
jgi:hypothetical protein